MKLAVFGSTGKIGQNVVAQALQQGHLVTAFARNPDKLKNSHKNLKIVKGDMLDPVAVRNAVEGQDAVLCTLGMPIMNKDGLREKGTRNIVHAMQEADVKRLICLSMLGVGDSFDMLPFHYRYLIIPLILGRVAADHEKQEEIISNSNLDWVMARPGNFTKGARTGAYRHGFSKIAKSMTMKIAQADVADFMLKQLADDTYLFKAPGLSS